MKTATRITMLSLSVGLRFAQPAWCQNQRNAGIADDFALPTDPAAPRTALAEHFIGTDPNNPREPLRAFDETQPNATLAHTFADLPVDIVAARLEVRVRSATAQQAETDALALQWMNGSIFAYSIQLSQCPLAPGELPLGTWGHGETATFLLDLGDLPISGGVSSILPHIRSDGYLDLVVTDDSAVDYARLTFWVECTADLNGDGAVAIDDLATLLAHYGQDGHPRHEDGDLDGDSDVDLDDLSSMLSQFGRICS